MKESKVEKVEHPGRVLRELYLERLGVTVTDASRALGTTRKNFSELLNGHVSVSAEMALRLSKVFGTSPHVWLLLQMEYDLARASSKLADLELERLA